MSGVAGADVLSFNRYLEILLNIGLGVIKSRCLKRLLKYSRNFSCKTEDALAIGTVSGDGYVENPVIKSENRLNIASGNSIVGKYE